MKLLHFESIIDHVKWFFFVQDEGGAKAGQKAGFHVMFKYFEIKKAFRYYIKQFVICSYHILTSSVIYYLTDARQHGIYLLSGARGKFGEHKRSIRVTRGDSRGQL